MAAAAAAAPLCYQLLASPSRAVAPPVESSRSRPAAAIPTTERAQPTLAKPTPAPTLQPAPEQAALPASPAGIPRGETPIEQREADGALGEADGVLPYGITAFDDVAGVARLDPALLDALRQASADAADAEILMAITSGWRSPAYQRQLLRDAVAEYGSEEEAARWVATPATSPHVVGQAVDIGYQDGIAWLAKHGSAYGLCQIYRNEPWHYELRPDASQRGCPPMYADPTSDPRMR